MATYLTGLGIFVALYSCWCFRQHKKETKHPRRKHGMRIYGERMTFAEFSEPPS